jgi:hypothetical protein
VLLGVMIAVTLELVARSGARVRGRRLSTALLVDARSLSGWCRAAGSTAGCDA